MNQRTKYVSIVAATILATMAWWIWRAPGANAKVDTPSSASEGTSTPHSLHQALSTKPARTDRLGDPNLNLLTTLRRTVAERGPDDLIVADMNYVGLSACLMVRDVKADDFRRKTPRHVWALQRVEHACKGFAIQGTKPVDVPALRDFRALRSQDPDAATLRALDILRTSDSRMQMRAALTHLEDERKFPLDYDPSLDPVELAKATEYAMIPVVCDATNDCGGQSLSAAMLCMLDGCSPGTTYDQALRRRLSPREYESAIRMRASLMALRERQR